MDRRLFIFASASWFSHSVRTDFRAAKWFRMPFRVSHNVQNWFGVQNFSHAMQKFRKVCELILQGVQINFARCVN